jgi:hypothetical protein
MDSVDEDGEYPKKPLGPKVKIIAFLSRDSVVEGIGRKPPTPISLLYPKC